MEDAFYNLDLEGLPVSAMGPQAALEASGVPDQTFPLLSELQKAHDYAAADALRYGIDFMEKFEYICDRIAAQYQLKS